MFRTIGDGPSEWECRLPAEVLRLPGDLARVDALLDDPVFFVPFARFFHPVLGRPSTPVECYLRLMFLKFRHRLGYESLCAEVSDSISWRRFCRIPLDGSVPHPTTLMKLANCDLWEAFAEHQDDFIYFYKSARRALEIYAEVLRVYALIENVHGALPKRGDVKRIRRDKNAQVRERERCIEAIGDLYGKFSAMLAVL